VFTKKKPISVTYGVGDENEEPEGRILTLEYEDFYLINVYTPNSQRDLARLHFRLQWEDRMRQYLTDLNEKKPIILCGDLNVAVSEIDLKNAKSNRGNSGFTDEERGKMKELLNTGFIDSFRYFYPDATDQYTWWSYMRNERERNNGWRIDYYIVSEKHKDQLKDSQIHSHVMGSDHCPVVLELQE